MEIELKKSTIIRPAKETPNHCLRNSDLDLVAPSKYVPNVFFYQRPSFSSGDNFFEAGLLKEALSKVLVPFYPVAGRLQKDENGRVEILCNGAGVLFLEAETTCVVDDFGDFSQGSKLLPLVPIFDDDMIQDFSSYPLLGTQVTHFKCGGVCIGTRLHHILADGASTYHFINSWAEMTRGVPVSIPPFLDRTILDSKVPVSPIFHHIEYDPPPSMNTPGSSISTSIFQLSFNQIRTLQEKAKNDHHGSIFNYTRLEILAAHIWRCVCKARGLSDDQATKLHFPTNGRSRLNPPLPSGYFANAVFTTAVIALSGNIQSEPLIYTVERIHKALKRMDDEYLKSALAYLKQQPDPTVVRRGAHTYKCPNFNIVYLANMPAYEANFGWGRPMFTRPVNTYFEGVAYVYTSPINDGSLTMFINLEPHVMQLFKMLFYDIFQQPKNARSRY